MRQPHDCEMGEALLHRGEALGPGSQRLRLPGQDALLRRGPQHPPDRLLDVAVPHPGAEEAAAQGAPEQTRPHHAVRVVEPERELRPRGQDLRSSAAKARTSSRNSARGVQSGPWNRPSIST
ncbi:unnamed protein product [Penicillium discolor]